MSGISKRSLLVLFFVLATLIAGCSSSIVPEFERSEAPAAEQTDTEVSAPALLTVASNDLWEQISQSGRMIVGTSADYPPFEYYTPNFKLDGFDIALMEEIGEILSIDIIFLDMAFDGLGDALTFGQIDSAIAAISVTLDRAEIVDFSGIYYKGEGAILASDVSSIGVIDDIEDLVGYRLAVETGSVYEDWLLENVVQPGFVAEEYLFVYGNIDQAIGDLISAEIDLVFLDAAPAERYAELDLGQLLLVDEAGETLLTFQPDQRLPLEGTEWVLRGYDDDGTAVMLPPGIEITLVLDEGTVGGNAGCNTYNAAFETNGDLISFSPAATTRMACPEPAMQIEQAYLAAFEQTSQYRIDGDTLVLIDEDGNDLLVYAARPEIHIDNIIWTLEAYGSPDDLQEPLPGTEITLSLDEEGGANGSTGCNRYMSQITIDGDTVTFDIVGTTRMACEDPISEQEDEYLDMLSSVSTAEFRAGKLLLVDEKGMQVLIFSHSKKDPLAGTEWRLETFAEADNGNVVLPDTEITLLFNDEDQLGGSAGCNSYSGGYEPVGETLTIGPLATTVMTCPRDEVNQQEQAYFVALDATRGFDILGVEIVGGGLSEQEFAIAVPEGQAALLSQINTALSALRQSGRIAQLAKLFLGTDPEDVIRPPTPVPPTPQPGCVDGMKWVADLTYDDLDMNDPPVMAAGEAFAKVWRLRNIGTCAWTSAYYIDYVGGNTNASRMSGERTFVDGPVAPATNYDLALDLIAPSKPGVYQGFWQMFNSTGKGFGPKLWVGIEVPRTPTPTPAPTSTPSPQVSLWADSTQIKEGQCTNLHWEVKNVKEVYLFPEGADWRNFGVAGEGSQTVCPGDTTTYILRVIFSDDTVQEWPVTIYVEPSANAPVIKYFTVDPPYAVTLGECVLLSWRVSGDTDVVTLTRNNATIWQGAPFKGSFQDCPPGSGSISYGLIAEGPGGRSRAVQKIDVIPVGPTPEPPEPTP